MFPAWDWKSTSFVSCKRSKYYDLISKRLLNAMKFQELRQPSLGMANLFQER